MKSKRWVEVEDSLQHYRYELTEPVGKNFDPSFTPDLTPKEMLHLGVFGGTYFSNEYQEFPKDWFPKAPGLRPEYDAKNNFYGVKASQSLEEWQKKGWIHPSDPRGWFQWYCRYYLGRRIPEEDARQIRRWKAFSRHAGQIKANCTPRDLSCRKVQRQALLHWAYDSRKM